MTRAYLTYVDGLSLRYKVCDKQHQYYQIVGYLMHSLNQVKLRHVEEEHLVFE